MKKDDKGYLLPVVTNPTDSAQICISVPCDANHALAFLGQIKALGDWWSWERDDDRRGKDAARAWRGVFEDVNRQLNESGVFSMSGCGCGCDEATIYKFTDDGAMLVSTDDGLTWSSPTTQDPRQSGTVFPKPAVTAGATSACQSAVNATNAIKKIMDKYIQNSQLALNVSDASLEIYLLFEVFLGAITALAVLIAQVVIIALSFADDVLTAAFTSDVYDRLKCNLACNTPEDGQHTAQSISDVIEQLAIDETGIAYLILKNTITALGAVGMTNAGRSGGADGDECETCGCDCVESQNYTAMGEDWTGGEEAYNGANPGRFLSASQGTTTEFTIPDRAGRTIASINVVWSGAAGSGGIACHAGAQNSEEGTVAFGGSGLHTFVPSVNSDDVNINVTGTLGIHLSYITINYDC